jgi:hypothetical protein
VYLTFSVIETSKSVFKYIHQFILVLLLLFFASGLPSSSLQCPIPGTWNAIQYLWCYLILICCYGNIFCYWNAIWLSWLLNCTVLDVAIYVLLRKLYFILCTAFKNVIYSYLFYIKDNCFAISCVNNSESVEKINCSVWNKLIVKCMLRYMYYMYNYLCTQFVVWDLVTTVRL